MPEIIWKRQARLYRLTTIALAISSLFLSHELHKSNQNIIALKSEFVEYQNTTDQAINRLLNIIEAERIHRMEQKTSVQREVACLADTIYHEAASEPVEGQLAVATVVMNRVKEPGYPKSVCGVTHFQKFSTKAGKVLCAFSWTCKPVLEPVKASSYRPILNMARNVYFKHVRNPEVKDAMFFHADYVKAPDWAASQIPVSHIGHHIFYKVSD